MHIKEVLTVLEQKTDRGARALFMMSQLSSKSAFTAFKSRNACW